jgi:AcrR family transcriptional regulator
MSKTFSERERAIIREKLIQSCKECWNRFGYQKTNVRELAAMANISTGAFYQFFESKELLFVETAQTYEKELTGQLHACMRETPGKRGLAEAVKRLCSMLTEMPWFMSLWEEWPVIIRKLPSDYMEKDFTHDMGKMKEVIDTYGLRPVHNLERVTQVIDLLAVCIMQRYLLPGDFTEAGNFIIDCVVNGLFL